MMAYEGSAARVFEHPLESGESSSAFGKGRKNKNPGGFGPSSLEAGLGSPFSLGPLGPGEGDRRKSPLAASTPAAQDAGDIPSMAQMAREAQLRGVQQAAYAGASQAARTAGSAVKEGASAITAHVKANPYSVTVLSSIGGCILALSSLMHLIWIVHVINPLPYILRVYELCFGVLIVVIDCPGGIVPQGLRNWALSLAPMQANTNRILFYLFIACLQGSLGTWFNSICGWYFAAVAILFTIVTLAGHNSQAQESPGGDHAVPLAGA